MLLEALLPEILDEIFSYLRVRELKNLARTNSSYNHILKQHLYQKLTIPLRIPAEKSFYCPEVFMDDDDDENLGDNVGCKGNVLTDQYFEFVQVLEVDSFHLSVPSFLRSVLKCSNLKRLVIRNISYDLDRDTMWTVFENLTTLETLRTEDSILLKNSGLEHIHRLSRLQELTLHNCRSSSNNTTVLLHLSALSSHLCKLDLSYCSTLGADVCVIISTLLVLKELVLKECLQIPDGGMVHICKLKKLQVLDLSSCGGTFGSMTVAGLVHLSRLSSLCELYLLDWMLTDDQFSVALSMTKLTRFRFGPALAFTVVENTDAVATTISKMNNLQSLELVNCDGITGEGYRRISVLPLLTELNLVGCGMTETALRSISMMVTLKVLCLNGCRDDTQGNGTIMEIAKLNRLQKLHMRNFYAVTDNFLFTLHESLPELKELDVSYSAITDEGLRYISMIRSLERLWLYKCREITNSGLLHISRMPALMFILLGGNGVELITREGIACLKRINEVRIKKGSNLRDDVLI